MNKLKIIIIIFVSFIIVSGLDSCSGCSRSGRNFTAQENESRYNRRRENVNNKTTEKEDVDIQETETPIVEHMPKGSKTIAELFNELEKGVFMVFALNNFGQGSQGSGFFISSDGIGITNYHVLDGFKNKIIQTSDGKQYEITKILETSNPDYNDYVIFKVDSKGTIFKSLEIANNKTPIGEDVFAIGSPKGLENSLTKGSVSQYRDNNRIQIDATIDHGSSGGPLFNLNGEVIGVTTSGIEGSALNFAVDIDVIPYEEYVKKH